MEARTEIAEGRWKPRECPFPIEYSLRVMDDIRLAVVDAFFSLPRGGVEIGGVLLGRYAGGGLSITGFAALECEHAFGPSFTLSQRDRDALAALLANARNSKDSQSAGWYHSHTRSEIFLSDADQEIHRQFFPEPWQVALVLRPHALNPARAGFFFRGVGGLIHAAASYEEITLEPLPMRAAIAPVIALAAEPQPVAEPAEVPAAPEPAPPRFLEELPQPPRYGLRAMLALTAVVAVAAIAYQTRPLWARDAAIVQERDDLALRLKRTNLELQAQLERNRKLQESVDLLRQQLAERQSKQPEKR